jgi:hypothetical protein
MKEMKKKTSGLYFLIFSSLIFLLFFRPGVAMRVSGDFDDRAYLCKAEKWVGIHGDFCPKSSHFSGIALTWFPAMLLARVFSFFDLGTFDNWAGFFVGMTSFICWIASLFLIEKIVALHTKEWEESPLKTFLNSWQYSILFLCNIPVLYFSTTRTFMVHAPELMWSLLLVYFCTRQNIFWALVSMLSLVLTRPNNLAAGLLFLVFLSRDPKSSLKNKNVFYASSMLLFGLGMVFFTYRFIFYGYNGTYFLPMLLDFQKQQLVSFLFREDFGIVWSQTLWLLSFLIWGLYFFKSSDIFATAGVWLLFSGSLSILWPTHGNTFGYRYLIGSYGGVLIIMLEALPKLLSSFSHRKIKGFMIAMTFFAVW